MKCKYRKYLEKLSKRKIGDIVERPPIEITEYDTLVDLVSKGYALPCRNESVVLIKEVHKDMPHAELKKRKDREYLDKLALESWKKIYNDKYSKYIPVFYAVYLFIQNIEIATPFTSKDIMQVFTDLKRSSVGGYLWLFANSDVLESSKRGIYEKVDEIPDYIISPRDLEAKKEVKAIKRNKNAFLYERARKAGLI